VARHALVRAKDTPSNVCQYPSVVVTIKPAVTGKILFTYPFYLERFFPPALLMIMPDVPPQHENSTTPIFRELA
jgi:hypothetical protein